MIAIAAPLNGAGAAASWSAGPLQQASQTAGTSPLRSDWFRRPAGAGDFQSTIAFPDIERPPVLMKYWPSARNLPGLCAALTSAYSDATKEAQAPLTKLEKRKLTDFDEEVLELPHLYERAGNLAAYNGDMETAVKDLEAAYSWLNQSIDFNPKGKQIKLLMEEEIGVAYMKLGEVQNCRLNHNAQTCIIPISLQGQHKLTTGSEKAIEYFNNYLATDPTNLEVRWLLNIAYMTLGKYPGS